jgi:signal transduction histidine kinase
MLQDFIDVHRDTIIARAREMVAARPWPPASTLELEYGIPLFLTQLSHTLRSGISGARANGAIGHSATGHGAELLALELTLSQVVHDYDAVCQAITQLALAQHAPITTEEVRMLNLCLDTAIAEAVTEHGRISAASQLAEGVERLGNLAHEVRDMLSTVIMAFDIIRRGTVSVNGSTGAVLAHSLLSMRHLVESTLADVRLSANQQRPERVAIASFLEDIAAAGRLQSDYLGQHFLIDQIEPDLAVDVDPQLLASAVTNVLNNAFKYTPPGGRILLRAVRNGVCVRIEVEDECGGIPEGSGDLFRPFGDRRGTDTTGLGLGLAIARRAVQAHDGDISVRNIPGKGCVFTIEIPLAAGDLAPAAA